MGTSLPVAVVGAGPIGLAAAAHLAERGVALRVLEAGPTVGHAIRQWSHVQVFSPWRYNVDAAARRILEATGWKHPTFDELPTGSQIITDYLEPLAAVPALRNSIRLNARVIAVGRRDYDKVKTEGRDDQPFVLRIAQSNGREEELLAQAVIDASGTWFTPNPLGSGGYEIAGERGASAAIAYGIPDVLNSARATYAGKITLVVGSGHSAINTLLDLIALADQEPGTSVLWGVRRADTRSLFGGEAADALQARGALGTRARQAVEAGRVELLSSFRARAIELRSGRLHVTGRRADGEVGYTVDRIVVAAGFRPDFSFLKEVRLTLDPWLEAAGQLAPLIDPNLHSCGTVRPHGAAELAHAESDFYIAGMKSYGRAPTFLMATGYEQVRSIVAELAGDHEAAARVELDLPETGVCSSTLVSAANTSSGCCGGLAPKETNACCLDDAAAKAAGEEGCGCPSVAIPVPVVKATGCCGR